MRAAGLKKRKKKLGVLWRKKCPCSRLFVPVIGFGPARRVNPGKNRVLNLFAAVSGTPRITRLAGELLNTEKKKKDCRTVVVGGRREGGGRPGGAMCG